ncbi:MAG: HAMP domain-containing sensor histidine kinase [Parvularculaceae bacterium]
MRPPKIWNSTPFKIAILNAASSSLLVLLTALIIYHNFHQLSRARIKQLLSDEYSVLTQRYAADGLDGLKRELNNAARAYSDEHRVYAVLSPADKIIAGNISTTPEFDGYKDLTPAQFGLKKTHRYIALSRRVDGYRVIIAFETDIFDRTSAMLSTTLVWASIAIIPLAILIGGIIGSATAARLRRMTAQIDRFAEGDTAARIDITGSHDDIDALAIQINEKLDRIERLMAAFRSIGADIAHDLKTPLSHLYLDLQSFAEENGADNPYSAKLSEAAEQTQSIVALFDSILNLARIENSPEAPPSEPVDLVTICKSLIETYEPIASDKEQSLKLVTKPAEPHVVFGDRRLLTQMIVNLIENAIRHTPQGVSIEVRIERQPNNSETLIVEDNGPGVAPGDRDNIFERFYRAEKSRTTPGSGLGMALVKAIADHHSAKISLNDAAPGLVVTVNFPARSPRKAGPTSHRIV